MEDFIEYLKLTNTGTTQKPVTPCPLIDTYSPTSSQVHTVSASLTCIQSSFLSHLQQSQELQSSLLETNRKQQLLADVKKVTKNILQLKATKRRNLGYMKVLHDYNDLKDIAFKMVELIAKKRNATVKEIFEEYEIKDVESSKDF